MVGSTVVVIVDICGGLLMQLLIFVFHFKGESETILLKQLISHNDVIRVKFRLLSKLHTLCCYKPSFWWARLYFFFLSWFTFYGKYIWIHSYNQELHFFIRYLRSLLVSSSLGIFLLFISYICYWWTRLPL